MIENVLGEAISAVQPMVFDDQNIALGGDWYTLAELGKHGSDVEAKLLIYSNNSLFDAYTQANLWSTNYFDQKKAEKFSEYTDGYACSLQFRAEAHTLGRKGEGFGVIMSQYGFQKSYDSQTQMELGIDDSNVNPTSVQGWNGVALHRRDQAQSVDTLTIQLLSLQMEEDVPILNEDLDLINFVTQDPDFPGTWITTAFSELVV